MKNKNYCVIEYVNGNGFEDDEGVEIVSVKGFESYKDGEKYLKKMIKEVKEMMNDNLKLVKKEDYSGCEGEGYFEDGEFVYCMESEGGFILRVVI
jgi:hypothetical protein